MTSVLFWSYCICFGGGKWKTFLMDDPYSTINKWLLICSFSASGMNNVVAESNEGDPSGVLLSSGYKAGPDVFEAPVRNKKPHPEGVELEITSCCC